MRWLDVVCLGFLMVKVLRGGEEGGDFMQEWVNVRAGVYESGAGGMNDGLV